MGERVINFRTKEEAEQFLRDNPTIRGRVEPIPRVPLNAAAILALGILPLGIAPLHNRISEIKKRKGRTTHSKHRSTGRFGKKK